MHGRSQRAAESIREDRGDLRLGKILSAGRLLGLGPGVHVGLHLPNTPHFVIGFFAVLMAGACVVNFSPLAAPRELRYQLLDADIQVMITLGLPMLIGVPGKMTSP